MKPDQFADQIRRKLESIEPTFREKDWVQMQHTMRVHGGGVYQPGLPQWVMPTMGGLAVASLATVVYFQYAANQRLQNEVQTLNQTVTQLRQTPQSTKQPPDTVYVTRYIDSPSVGAPGWKGGLSNEPVDRSLRGVEPQPQLTDSRQLQQKAFTEETENVPNPSLNTSVSETTTTSSKLRQKGNTNQSDRFAGVDSKPVGGKNNQQPAEMNGKESAPTEPVNQNVIDSRGNYISNDLVKNSRRRPQGATDYNEPGNGYPNSPSNGSNYRGNSMTDATSGRSADRDRTQQGGAYDNSSTGNHATVEPSNWALPGIEELASLEIVADSAYYREGMVKISRRIRRLLPTIAAQPIQPNPDTSVPLPNWRFRLGVGGFVGVQQLGGGLYSEVRLGSGWIVGVGLTNNRISGGTYLTDHLYQEKTKRDFRKEYAGGIDPRYEILNISRKATTWQVPITIGYQIRMDKNWSVVPTVGTNLNISNQEKIAFNYLREPNTPLGGPRELEGRYLLIQYPNSYMHSALFSIGIEKSWQRISVQAGPYMGLPLKINPYTLNTASGGIRARLYYRF